MIQNVIFQYVHRMFQESRGGELLVGDADNQFGCPVEWDEKTADALAHQCSALVLHLRELSSQFEKLCCETQHLSQEQMEVWDTYLRPFPKHNMDMEKLQEVWDKTAADICLTEEEWDLADRYVDWFEENALTRLPVKRCHPVHLLNRAKRYCKLVQLNAPADVQENEAKRFAEDFVMYHCMKR